MKLDQRKNNKKTPPPVESREKMRRFTTAIFQFRAPGWMLATDTHLSLELASIWQ